MAELYLVRHAQASFGTGDYDRLSALGRQQALWLGQYFRARSLEFDAIVSGDMTRQLETTALIAEGMGAARTEPEIDPDWNEFDFEAIVAAWLAASGLEPPGAGASRADFTRILRDALHAWSANRLDGTVPEPWVSFEQRVRLALARSMERPGKPRRILVVSSGGAIAMALRQVLGAPASAMVQMNLQVRNSSISHLWFNGQAVHFSGFNHVPHLDLPDRAHSVTYY